MKERFLVDESLAAALADAGVRGPESLYRLAGDAGTSHVGPVALPVAGTRGRFHLKCYRYPGWRKSKGLVGRGSLLGTPPEIAEFEALAWLRAHDVPAARPVAAAATTVRGRLAAHALLTEDVAGAQDLVGCLADPTHPLRVDRPTRRRVAATLGRVLARMHLHGFAHRDLHARNILVRIDAAGPRVWLIDCRRGGPGRAHHRLRDLAMLRRDLLVAVRPPWSPGLWAHLLGAYLGVDVGAGALDERLARVRLD